jgi:UDP-perosamine 4-acetyltransferase
MTEMQIVVIGAGGHAAVLIELLRAAALYSIIGVVDPDLSQSDVLGVPLIGGEDLLPALRQNGVASAVVALGSNRLRQAIGDRLVGWRFSLPPIVHPTAFVSPSATLGEGVVVMARAVIGARARANRLAIINTGAIVEHDNDIGAAAHVAPGVALAGNVRVGARALIGIGTAVRPGVRIGEDAVVGAGSAVVTDIAAGMTVAGAPARPLRKQPPPFL